MLRLLIFFTLCQFTCAGDIASKILGSWSSDLTLTNQYLNKHAKLSEYQKKVLPKFFGNSVITFKANGTGLIRTKEFSMPRQNGEDLKMPATITEFTYEILGEAQNQIVMKSNLKENIFADSPFCIVRFEDANTYSVSISDGISDINGREFFKRINQTTK